MVYLDTNTELENLSGNQELSQTFFNPQQYAISFAKC